jgi:hypothetical protein
MTGRTATYTVYCLFLKKREYNHKLMIIVIRVINISKDITSFKTLTMSCDVERRISYRQTNTSLENGIHSYVQETIWNP